MNSTACALVTLIVVNLTAAAGCDRPPDADEALYRRAHDAGTSRRAGEAEALYRQLLREHPSSRFSPEAHFALAELFFTAGDFERAFAEYGAVLAFPEAKTWGYALYKQGWCQLNQGKAQAALATFERVIALERDDRVPADRRVVLVAEARRDLVKAYAGLHGPERAAEYFQTWGGGDRVALLERLGELYFEQRKPAQAGSIYRDLVAADPGSQRLCVWQSMLVRIALASAEKKEQVGEVQRLGAVLARLEQNGDAPAAVVDACRVTLRDTLKEMALLAHKQAQQEKQPQLYELADPLYRQYLARFRAEQDTSTMTFYHAELLWSLGRFAEAADGYRRVLELEPKGKLAKEAAYAMVLANKNALGIDEEGRGPEPVAAVGATHGPRPLPPSQTKMIAAYDLYLTHITDGPELPRIKYRKARTYYDLGHHDTAARLFRAFADQHPGDELATFAVNLELDALNVLGRNAELCARAGELRMGPIAAADAKLAGSLDKIRGSCDRSPKTPKTP